MLGEAIPKHIQKKITTQREARGLPPLEEVQENTKKKKREKPTIDVSYSSICRIDCFVDSQKIRSSA